MTAHSELLLEVKDLNVSFSTEEGIVRAVDEVSFELRAGEVLAVVGESGSGKSVTAMTLMGLTRSPNARFAGSARLRDLDLIAATGEQLRAVRGEEIAMIFQDPMTSLNPVHRIGKQIVEQIQAHREVSPRRRGPRPGRRPARARRHPARPRALRRLPARVLGRHAPARDDRARAVLRSRGAHRRRADDGARRDDPGADLLQLFKDMRGESNTGIILVTHDLGVVADIADRIAVMYAGRIVEQGTTDEIFYNPQHPYTWGLLGSITRVDRPRPDRLPSISGLPPSLINPPQGCHFRPRCPHAHEACLAKPALEARVPGGTGHTDRCVLSPEQKAKLRQTDGQIGLEAGGVTV